MISQSNANGTKHTAQVLAEFRDEIKEFFTTRLQLFKSEFTEKIQAWKAGIPMLLAGALLLGTAWLLFIAGMVIGIAMLLPQAVWTLLVAVLLVMAGFAVAGGIMAYSGWRSIARHGAAPERTLRVLKQDQIWLRAEVRTQQ